MGLDAPAHTGSFRILEAELFGVLSVEPLPTTNLSFTTEPEPLPRLVCASNTPLPGPFTDEQLLPAGVFETVVKFGQRVQLCVERALQPGEQGHGIHAAAERDDDGRTTGAPKKGIDARPEPARQIDGPRDPRGAARHVALPWAYRGTSV